MSFPSHNLFTLTAVSQAATSIALTPVPPAGKSRIRIHSIYASTTGGSTGDTLRVSVRSPGGGSAVMRWTKPLVSTSVGGDMAITPPDGVTIPFYATLDFLLELVVAATGAVGTSGRDVNFTAVYEWI